MNSTRTINPNQNKYNITMKAIRNVLDICANETGWGGGLGSGYLLCSYFGCSYIE